MRKSSLKLLAILAVLVMVFTAGCAKTTPAPTAAPATSAAASAVSTDQASATSTASGAALDPFRKYPELITLTAGQSIRPSAAKLPQGDTLEDNQFTRYWQSISNIKVVDAFQAQDGDAYKQKVKLVVASNDLPDMMVVQDYSLLKQMVEAGQVQDMTDAYNNGAWPLAKDIFAAGGGKALQMATFDGKLMAIPDTNLDCNDELELWLRQDWLDKLGLQPPKTVDDLVTIANAFIAKDPDGDGQADTIGLTGNKDIIASTNGFDNIFHAFNSYPQKWIKDGSGNAAYGSILPETKIALAKLADMYKQGVIDKEFAVKQNADTNAMIISGKAGMFFFPFWAGWSPLSDATKNNPKAQWKAYAVPLDASGKYNVSMEAPATNFFVAKAGTKDPNAVMEYYNLWARFERMEDPMTGKIYPDDPDLQDPINLTPVCMTLDYVDALDRKNLQYQDVINGKASIDSLNAEGKSNVQAIEAYTANPGITDVNAFQIYHSYVIGGACLLNNPALNKVYPVFTGQTDTMATKWASLLKLENESMLKIIMGQETPDYFDQFVLQWKALGGDQITAEVQAATK